MCNNYNYITIQIMSDDYNDNYISVHTMNNNYNVTILVSTPCAITITIITQTLPMTIIITKTI